MTLIRETLEFFRWLAQVILTFIRVRPLTTIVLIVLSAFSHILHLLAFLLPLKVLMLAATSGVPGKLAFIPPEQKDLWIYILAGASIASYFLMILSDSLTDRLSLSGSEHLLHKSEAVPLFANQKTLAQSYYSSFCQISADFIYVGLAYLAIFFIYFHFFVFLAGSIVFLYLLSCLFVRPLEKSLPGTFSHYLRENSKSYLSVLSSLLFLGAFVFLLIPFLFFENSSFLLALASFIILRRTLSALRQSIQNAIKLSSQKHRINALIFPDVQLRERQQPEELAFFELFGKQERTRHAKEALEQVVPLESDIEVKWEDSPIAGMNTFAVLADNSASDEARCFRLHVFPPKQVMRIENEEFLFSHIPRQHLKAPAMQTLYFAGQYQCQILDYGWGEMPGTKQWPELEDFLLGHLWSVAPPQDLIRTYCSSAPLLHERLSADLVSSLEIAADTQQERQTLQAFLDRLPAIGSRLELLPLHIYNPDLKKNTISLGQNQEPLIMFWGRWSLQPVGAGLPNRLRKNGISTIVEQVRENRRDIPEGFSEQDLFLAADCFELESLIRRKKYKSGLETMGRILENGSQAASREQISKEEEEEEEEDADW